MRSIVFALLVLVASPAMAQVQRLGLDNPEIKVIWPMQNGPFIGGFVVEVKNFSYRPELATNPVAEFAVGRDAAGDGLLQSDGHLHGWVFKTDRWGNLKRDDSSKPTPASYLRFYGAGGADWYPSNRLAGGYYVKPDDLSDLRRGWYRCYFQLQQNDHTAALQATAPAFPGITSVDFYVR